jgi:hypothetical protein
MGLAQSSSPLVERSAAYQWNFQFRPALKMLPVSCDRTGAPVVTAVVALPRS